jgi:hypothetical protein
MEKERTLGMKLVKQGLCRGLQTDKAKAQSAWHKEFVIVVGVGVLKEMWDVSKLILLENPLDGMILYAMQTDYQGDGEGKDSWYETSKAGPL